MDKLKFSDFKGKSVAVKMHLGGGWGYTTIRPFFVRTLVDQIRDAGGRPFITDGIWSADDIARRGYTEETLGAKIVRSAGEKEKYFKTVKVDFESVKELHLCGKIIDADAMVVLSHFKGHGEASYGGAIKNIAMGCVTCASRGALHSLERGGASWDKAKCSLCEKCVSNCRHNALFKDQARNIVVNTHNCVYCKHCEKICPTGALKILATTYKKFQEGLAIATVEVLKYFKKDDVKYVNVAMDITPFCDCWGFSTPAVVPDLGIFGSMSITGVDKAALDKVETRNFIRGSLPAGRQLLRGKGHLFQRIWGNDPYEQLRAAERAGLGKADYRLVEIR